ncbi:hypothetical protein SUGI_0358930 [Cryptomeria japonica]|nr:hypothetical protein SUGI_0358930 [Cryptomeria japonica]
MRVYAENAGFMETSIPSRSIFARLLYKEEMHESVSKQKRKWFSFVYEIIFKLKKITLSTTIVGPRGCSVASVLLVFWTDILRATDANIVKEVQAECDDLPLALKASIDSLGDPDNDCFLDLVLFLEDKKICGDALLDICVYVQNLQRCDAFGILSEFASRNLLNLSSNPRLVQASIDSLGDPDNDCFLDLVLFLEDKKICGDVLLDTCVYVQNLQRCDAFGILSEFASRNLLNLSSNPRGRQLHNDRAIHLTVKFSPFPLILWRKLLA